MTPDDISGELSGGIQTGHFAAVRQGSYELITPLRERPDECRLFGPIAQYLSDFEYVLSDAFRIDIGTRPDRLQKLILRDQAVCVFDQVAQYIERFGSQRRTFIV